MAQKATPANQEFVYEKAIQLLTSTAPAKRPTNRDDAKIEFKLMLTKDGVGNSLACFVNKIDVRGNFVEVCDTKYSIKCKFVGK